MIEMITTERYIDRPDGRPPFIFCVFNSQDLNQVTWAQRAEAGGPEHGFRQKLAEYYEKLPGRDG